MTINIDPEDEVFLNRLFGSRIPQDDRFRPALEWACHVGILKGSMEGATWERFGKPMMANLVGHCLYKGIGTHRSIVGWSLEDSGDQYILGVLVVKQEALAAA